MNPEELAKLLEDVLTKIQENKGLEERLLAALEDLQGKEHAGNAAKDNIDADVGEVQKQESIQEYAEGVVDSNPLPEIQDLAVSREVDTLDDVNTKCGEDVVLIFVQKDPVTLVKPRVGDAREVNIEYALFSTADGKKVQLKLFSDVVYNNLDPNHYYRIRRGKAVAPFAPKYRSEPFCDVQIEAAGPGIALLIDEVFINE